VQGRDEKGKLMLVIHDEHLAKRLQELAARENRSVEEMLQNWAAQHITQSPSEPEPTEAVRRVRAKAYVKARKYWESIGDTAKAALTDAELDEQFGVFDEEGIPRLKSELKSLEPPVGSLAYAAKLIDEMGGIPTGKSDVASRADEILNEEFADYLLQRMRDQNAPK
jgi:hypothetical protein